MLYGGARGGGKTDAGMAWLLYWKDVPLYRALVIRRNADDLKDWIDRARMMYAPTNAQFVGNPAEIRFPSGAKIRTGHLKDENAYTKYQGHEYQKMLIEELTHIPREGDYEKLLGSNRSTVPGLKPQVFCTTNPDGDGHEWVKERFDCGNPDEKVREFKDEATQLTKSRVFIPAKVEDNPTLIENDPKYVAYLNSIKDPVLRRQWREGSWEEPLIEGAYYAQQLRDAQSQGRITSVPYELAALVDTWWDLGIGDATAIWFTQTIGKEIRFIDYYEAEGEGLPHYIQVLRDKGYLYGIHHAPHDIEVRELTSGKSRLEIAQGLGINFDVVPKLLIDDGINAARMIFNQCWFDKDKCKQGLTCLKHYRKEFDEKMQTFKDKPMHNWASHGADAFRYFAIGYREIVKASRFKREQPFNKYEII